MKSLSLKQEYDQEYIHKDTFDRLLIGQSIIEGIPILTIDSMISTYKEVKTIW